MSCVNCLSDGTEAAAVGGARFRACQKRQQAAAERDVMGKNSEQYQVDPHNTVTEELIGERRLWTAVVISAVEDWRNGSLRTQRKAQEFLFGSDTDFQTVCARAGLEPTSLRTRLLKVGKLVEMHGTVAPGIAA